MPVDHPVAPRRRAAFFDFDGTLIRGDSQTMEAIRRLRQPRHRALSALRLIPTTAIGLMAAVGVVSQRMQCHAYIKTYRGSKQTDLIEQGEALFESNIRRAFIPHALEIVAAHRRTGDAIVIVSATPQHILAPVAKYLKPDSLICTRLEADGLGRCTGRSLGAICIGIEKATRIRELAACHRLDLAAAHAYCDHPADLPMLTSVGHPHVVNPSKRLAKIARRHGWPIHRCTS
jgi:HAD superfamily hydrolase (TIGR01490 family)